MSLSHLQESTSHCLVGGQHLGWGRARTVIAEFWLLLDLYL